MDTTQIPQQILLRLTFRKSEIRDTAAQVKGQPMRIMGKPTHLKHLVNPSAEENTFSCLSKSYLS